MPAEAVPALTHLAERCAIPVVAHNPRSVCLPSSHPMHFGFEPGALFDRRRSRHRRWNPTCRGSRICSIRPPAAASSISAKSRSTCAIRCAVFPSDLAVQAGTTNALDALDRALEPRLQMAEARIAARRARLTERMRTRRAQLAKDAAPGDNDFAGISLAMRSARRSARTPMIFNEYPLRPDHCAREKPGTFFALGPAGGLGWGLGAALGAKLAAPDKLIVATLGDGAYMFANPMVGHWVSAAHKLPILTIVFNNSRYGAVRRSTLSMFKDGAAGENDGRILADLDPAPPYEEMARAQGAHAERVEKPAELPDALARARDAVVVTSAAGAAQRHYALLKR